MEEMKNKVCVITGGGGAIGLASARRMYDAGARIMLVDLSADALATAKASFEDADRVATCTADVSDVEQTQAYISETVNTFGKIDVLMANAGFSGTNASTADYPEDLFDKVMAVNVRGSFLSCKYALGEMNDGGSIILMSSIMGVTARPNSIAYITSKHALIGMMRGVAKEMAPRNIRANVLAPGPTTTAFQQEIEDRITKATGNDATEMLNNWIPLGRHATSEEIANAAYFLASDQSSFTTGAVLMADGGMHI